MPLELRKNSSWWYGRFKANNQRHCVNLGVEVRGQVPNSLKKEGDSAFERSRAKAQEKLEQLASEAKSKSVAQHYLEKLYEIKSGEPVGALTLKEMPKAWESMPVKRPRAPRYIELGLSIIQRFATFMTDNYPTVKTMSAVTPKMANAFLAAEHAKGVSGRTWNSKLILLRSAFRRLARQAGIASNPFEGIGTRDEDTMHRQPFNEQELKAILEKADDFSKPIIITGMSTAMRLGDCCLLKWKDVDVKAGFVVVKTSKTGETAEIPLFPMLRDTIGVQKKSDDQYVFSEQAEAFSRYRHTITRKVKRVLKAASITSLKERENGNRRASVRDFHSFRTTWITLALSAGVPMELVRRVTGHATVDVVLKHYFRPGRKEFRSALQDAMPKLLTDGVATTEPQHGDKSLSAVDIRSMVHKMNARNWKKIREKILVAIPEEG